MGRAQAVVWSPDSARIATAGDNGVVNVCESTLAGGLIQIRLEPLSDLSWMGDALAVAGSNGIAVIDVHV